MSWIPYWSTIDDAVETEFSVISSVGDLCHFGAAPDPDPNGSGSDSKKIILFLFFSSVLKI